MIDFRYHIVSIVAVFLALALGLVLGTSTINPIVIGDLKDRVTQLVNDKRALQTDVETLRAQAADGTAFAQAATVPLVADQLPGRGVVVVSLPGTPATMRDNLVALLAKAGAHLSARVSLTDAYADPAKVETLASTVTASTPADVVLTGSTASQRSGELLAAVLSKPTTLPGAGVSPSGDASVPSGTAAATPSTGSTRSRSTAAGHVSPPITSASASATPTPTPTPTPAPTPTAPGLDETSVVLSAYAAAGLLTVDAPQPVASDLVLVLTPDGPAAGQSPPVASYDGYVDLLGALVGARHASVVVAGPTGAVTRGVVDYVRRSGVDPRVSTIDAAETPAGAVATIRALRAQLFGHSGRYGAAPNDAALPPADGQ